MNRYELTVVIAPGQTSEKLTSLIASVEKAVKSVKGKVVESEDWGEKQLAYVVKKFDRALYRHFVLELPPAGALSLETKLKHLPSVLRLLLVRV